MSDETNETDMSSIVDAAGKYPITLQWELKEMGVLGQEPVTFRSSSELQDALKNGTIRLTKEQSVKLNKKVEKLEKKSEKSYKKERKKEVKLALQPREDKLKYTEALKRKMDAIRRVETKRKMIRDRIRMHRVWTRPLFSYPGYGMWSYYPYRIYRPRPVVYRPPVYHPRPVYRPYPPLRRTGGRGY